MLNIWVLLAWDLAWDTRIISTATDADRLLFCIGGLHRGHLFRIVEIWEGKTRIKEVGHGRWVLGVMLSVSASCPAGCFPAFSVRA